MRLRPALARLLSAAGAVLAAGALAASGVAHAAVDLNVIRAVDVKDEGGTIVLTVQGSKPPNFTTFSMADPPRFVIDLSESRFQGVPEDLVVHDGVVNVVKSLSYGSDASSIARVMVAFLVDVDPPDVQAVGNALVVRVTKPAGVGVAAAPAAKAAAEAEARAAAQRKAEEEQRAQEAQARADAERDRLAAEAQAEAGKAEAQVKAQAEAEKAALAQAQAEAEKAAQAKADAEKAAQAQAQAQAEAEKAAQAQAAAQARAEQEAKAKAEAAQAIADREAAAAQKGVEEQLARAEAEKAAREEEERRARAAYEAERQAALAKASAPLAAEAAPEPTRGEVAAAAEPADPSPAPAAAPAAQADAAPVVEQAHAASAAPAADPEPAPVEQAVDAAPAQESDELAATALAPAPSAQLREVGFRQLPGASRVFFRTTVTPRFSVQDVGENVIRVELENTRAVRRNDTRFLDTSFFSSAVALVTPRRQGTSYVVEIRLRERVPYQQRIEGDMLALDFARPAAFAAGPAAEPAAAAQPDPLPGEGEPLAPAAAPAN